MHILRGALDSYDHMAKSKRSKVKRSFRAVKRHKAAPKVAAQLKRILATPAGGNGLPYVVASKIVIPEDVKEDSKPIAADEGMIMRQCNVRC